MASPLLPAHQMLALVLDALPVGLFWKDLDSCILGCNQKFADDSGVANPADLIGKTNFDFYPTEQAEAYRADDLEVMTSGLAKLGIEESLLLATGQTAWVETNKVPMRNKAGDVIGVLGTYRDVTERRRADDERTRLALELAEAKQAAAMAQVEYLAYYDALTGLANRTLFLERVEQKLSIVRPVHGKAAVFVLNLERFKSINDVLGRQAGDELLKQIGRRLVSAGGGDAARFARIGADQFAAISIDVENEQQVARYAEQRLTSVFGPPYFVDGHELRVGAKCGIAMCPLDGADADTLFRNAEAALKRAKASGEHYLFYAEEMTERVAEKLALENKLRQALDGEQFVLHYQPKIDVKTRSIVGVEALIRWETPDHGLVFPLDFIPLLEETGLILEVGTWALRRAALDRRRWVEKKLMAPRIAVNVSQVQLRQRDFVQTVERAIEHGVGPAGIDLEITETLVMSDINANIEKLKALRKLGVNVAIDDFGTGYSSLAYLAQLPVEALKIDRAFISTMLDNVDSSMLVRTMISLAHSLRLKVVAEGVETEAQADMLGQLQCDEMQGFLFSKPLTFDTLTAQLNGAQLQAIA